MCYLHCAKDDVCILCMPETPRLICHGCGKHPKTEKAAEKYQRSTIGGKDVVVCKETCEALVRCREHCHRMIPRSVDAADEKNAGDWDPQSVARMRRRAGILKSFVYHCCYDCADKEGYVRAS